MTTRLTPWMALLALTLAACGGTELDVVSPDPGGPAANKGGGTVGPSPLPTAPPSPDMVIRESFGFGPDHLRPASGKGVLKPTFGNVGGFWVEYPGTKNGWIAAEQGWQFAGCSDDPWELPSPLQPLFNGCTVSPWTDGAVKYPDALVPFSGLAGPYELSAELYPGVLPGAYVAIGLTGSGATSSNLRTSGQVWLLLRQGPALDGLLGEYELRLGGSGGTILATGTMVLWGYNPVVLRFDPAAETVTATIDGQVHGPFDAPGVAPRYAAVEGQGVLDNFVVRRVQ